MVYGCIDICNYDLVPFEKAGFVFISRTNTVDSDG